MADCDISFSPKVGEEKSPTVTAEWLRKLAADVEAQKIQSFALKMDCFNKMTGRVSVQIPSDYLGIKGIY